jgi:hypothetical protein
MGVGFSQPGSLAKIDHHWVLENDAQFKFTNSVSLESVKKGEDRVLLAAYLASAASYEGSPGQHIRLATSKDGARTAERPAAQAQRRAVGGRQGGRTIGTPPCACRRRDVGQVEGRPVGPWPAVGPGAVLPQG